MSVWDASVRVPLTVEPPNGSEPPPMIEMVLLVISLTSVPKVVFGTAAYSEHDAILAEVFAATATRRAA